MFTVGQQVEVVVEKVVFGGHGLIRHQGWVIFVDDVLPGEKILVEITQRKKSYFLARLLTVIHPSLERVSPICPYFGHCGGCQLQMTSYAQQVAFKEKWLQEALNHRLTLPSPIKLLPATKQFGYRRRITLHLHFQEQRPILGYYAKGSHQLIDVANCAIFRFPQDDFFAKLREWIAPLRGSEETRADLTIVQLEDQYLLQLAFHSNFPGNINSIIEGKLPSGCRSLRLTSPKKSLQIGDDAITITASNLQTVVSGAVFLQNYPEQSEQLYRDVVDQVERGNVLDLYCGIGILTQLLAQRNTSSHVIGIESNWEAIELAKKSIIYNGLLNVEFIAGRVEECIKQRYGQYPIWIINPPRQGLSEKMRALIFKWLPKQLIYISCMPSTLERDLFALCEKGYVIQAVQGYDMFPQTTHLETLVILQKK